MKDAINVGGEGSNVVEIGDFSVERARRILLDRHKVCQHRKVMLEEVGEIVRCRDCKEQVTAWWLLNEMVSAYRMREQRLNSVAQQLAADAEKFATDKAALHVSKAWRMRRMVPACPHCHKGIGPKDGFGASLVRKDRP